MISALSALNPVNQQFVNNLSNITQDISNDELDITSGVDMRNLSDNPDEISSLLQTRAQLSATQQVSTDLGMYTTEVNTGESSLQSAVQLFTQVQTLAAEGATGTETAATQSQLGTQIQSLEQQMVGLANTQVNGRFIFAGDEDQTQPYTFDATQTDPVSAYQGSASTREATAANGTSFPIALTAQQIFDSSDPSTNVFTAINNVVTALNNNDQSGVQTALNAMTGVASYLNDQLAFYGNAQDNLTNATTQAQAQTTQLQTQISNLQDTDVTATITDMTQAQTQEQAALGAEAEIPRQTLFDFLAS
jgi:flagellar hook-associated protein 3 FlgL